MKISVIGSYGIGLTMHVDHVPGPGETLIGGQFSRGPGGKGSNQAIAAARLGAEVAFLTAIGSDEYALMAQELWRHEGVDASSVVHAKAATMVGMILVTPDGENRIAISPGALLELTDNDVEGFRVRIRESVLTLVSMEIPLPVVIAALRVARDESKMTVLNPAPATPLPDSVWSLIDVITPNRSEVNILLGRAPSDETSPDDLLDALRNRFDGGIVLTLGSDGALVDDGRQRTNLPALPVLQVIDTTGAGDAFTAALAVSLAEGRGLAEAAVYANAAGAYAVSKSGVIDALPTRTDIDKLYNVR